MTTAADDGYLPEIPFNDKRYYTVVIGQGGLTVYSECCADTMSRETAARVHEALGRWLADTADLADPG